MMELSLCRVCTCLPLQGVSLFLQLCFLLLSVLWQKLTSFINLWHCTNLHPLLGSWWSKWQCYGSWSRPHMLLLNISEDACDFIYHSCCCWRCMKIVGDCNIHVAVEALWRSEDACDCTMYVEVSQDLCDCAHPYCCWTSPKVCMIVPFMLLLLKISKDACDLFHTCCCWRSLKIVGDCLYCTNCMLLSVF